MGRILKWLGIVVAVLVGLPVLLVLAVIGLANVDTGRRLIERETASLTGGMVRLQDLSGTFPNALRVGRVDVADAKGVYVTIDGLALDWSPLNLLRKTVLIDQLSAQSVDVSRLPVSGGASSSSSGSFSLPVRVDLRRLSVAKAIIGAPVAGTAATLGITGSGSLESLTEGQVHLAVQRLDQPGGQYNVDANLSGTSVSARLAVQEPAKGLIATIAQLPDLGAVSVQAQVDGPEDALKTNVSAAAGPLHLETHGSVDATHRAADLQLHAEAPAMQPAPGIAWQSVLVDGHVQGPFIRPDARATVRINGLTASGGRIGAIAADVKGNQGHADLHASVTDALLPGPKPDLLAQVPVVIDGAITLDQPDRPVTFAIHHTLLDLTGTASLGTARTVQAHLVVPDLAPLAQVAGADLKGHTALDIGASMNGDRTDVTIKGPISVTGGMRQAQSLVGSTGTIDVAAEMKGQDFTLQHATVAGKSMSVDAKGAFTNDTINADWSVSLSDLAAIQPDVSGKLDVKGQVTGKLDDIAVKADVVTNVTAKGYKSGQVTAHIDATGLPSAPKASITAGGTLLDAPLNLVLTADRTNNVIHANIGTLSWKSLTAGGAVSYEPPTVLPSGDLHLTFTRLADLQPLLNKPISGSAAMTLHADGQGDHVSLQLKGIAIPNVAEVRQADADVTVTDPTGTPSVDATVTATGIGASSVHNAQAKVTAKGGFDAIVTNVTANASDVAGGPARIETTATVNAKDRRIELSRLQTSWKTQTLRLLAPARIDLRDGVAIDQLRIGYGAATLTVAGSAGQTLNLTAQLRNLSAGVASIADPSFAADGTITADVQLKGTTARPEGQVKLTARRVHLKQGTGAALPPADLVANATLQGTSAQIDTRLTAGQTHLAVTGTAPLSTTGQIDLSANGQVQLTMLDPILAAQGQRVRGTIVLNATIGGTATVPKINGSAALHDGDVVDYAQGAHIDDLEALIEADGDTIRLTRFSGRAGQGTLGGGGTIGLGTVMPVDLHFTASHARPLSSDLLTAIIDADATIQGDLKGALQVTGRLKVERADIRIPDSLPPSVAVLPVRNANVPPPPPPPPSGPSSIALNLTIEAPQQVFIRGHGIDAELGGTIHIHGTATDPQPDGGLSLRTGTLSVIGTTLTFSDGTVSFNGAAISNPSILFDATSSNATMTAKLTVSGTAKAPKITLSSVPDMPQDEILAQLLFNTSATKLSPFQLAEIASALASLSGATGSFDPLDSLRTGLGLDRLSVGSSSSGDPTLQAGRYVARGVYVGAQQGTSGGGPQATVQIDLAKGLQAQATAGSSQSTATGASQGTDAASIGLKYQFEY